MNERFIYPTKPDDILKELTDSKSNEIDDFVNAFPKEILNFSESFSKSYKKYLELYQITSKHQNSRNIEQIEFVTFFTYQILNNLFISERIFLLGFEVASGNILRQVAEGVAVVVLCSINFEISRVSKRKQIKFSFFDSFKQDKPFARSNNAIRHLENNRTIIQFSEQAIDLLVTIKKQCNEYSHPNVFNTSAFMSFEKLGRMYIGGCFDRGKIENYQVGLEFRAFLCSTFSNLIDGLKINIEKLF